MNRSRAKKIAESITNLELKQMFDSAKVGIKNWSKVSIVNNGMSKGFAWNILAKDFDENKEYTILAKINMVREFGEFLQSHKLSVSVESKTIIKTIVHQDPIF